MGEILIQAVRFMLVVLVAYSFKRMGMFKAEDGKTLSNIVLNITLPAVVIIGFNNVNVDATFYLLILLGILTNLGLAVIGGLLWKQKKPIDKSLIMLTLGGYNIGNFTLPFVQGFFPEAIPYIGSFDMGNSLMIAGGTALVVDRMTIQSRESFSIGRTLGKLFSSPPLVTYVSMFLLALLNLSVPTPITSVLEIFAGANSFLVMFMLGLYLEIRVEKVDHDKVTTILGYRYLFAALLACAFYFLLPLPEIVRVVLVLVMLSPVANLSAITSIVYGTKPAVAGYITSISILCSLLLMTGVLVFLL